MVFPSLSVLLSAILVDAKSHLKLLELTRKDVAAAVNMLGFSDKADVFIWIDVVLDQDLFEGTQWLSVSDDHLVFIELNFLLLGWIQDSDARATVVEYHFLEIKEDTFQHRHIDMFAI